MQHLRHRTVAATIVAFALGATPFAAFASQTISAGNGLNGSLQNSLNTKTASAGQPVAISIVAPYPSGVSALGGATIYGHVGQATPRRTRH